MQAEVNGTVLYYRKRGSGPPLVLIHGNGDDHTFFDALTASVKDRYTVYAPDSRCHGRSQQHNSISYVDLAEDTAALIRMLELAEKPILIGASDGGIVGLLLMIHHPDLLAACVCAGANTNPKGLKPLFRSRMHLEYLFGKDPKVGMMLKEPQIPPSDLQTISAPTLIVAGSRDLIKERHTRKLAAYIPKSKFAIFKGEDHTSYLQNGLSKFLPVLNDFLEGVQNDTDR